MPEFIFTNPDAPMMTETEDFSPYEMFKNALSGDDMASQGSAVSLGVAFMVCLRAFEEFAEPGEVPDPDLMAFLALVHKMSAKFQDSLVNEALAGLLDLGIDIQEPADLEDLGLDTGDLDQLFSGIFQGRN